MRAKIGELWWGELRPVVEDVLDPKNCECRFQLFNYASRCNCCDACHFYEVTIVGWYDWTSSPFQLAQVYRDLRPWPGCKIMLCERSFPCSLRWARQTSQCWMYSLSSTVILGQYRLLPVRLMQTSISIWLLWVAATISLRSVAGTISWWSLNTIMSGTTSSSRTSKQGHRDIVLFMDLSCDKSSSLHACLYKCTGITLHFAPVSGWKRKKDPEFTSFKQPRNYNRKT